MINLIQDRERGHPEKIHMGLAEQLRVAMRSRNSREMSIS